MQIRYSFFICGVMDKKRVYLNMLNPRVSVLFRTVINYATVIIIPCSALDRLLVAVILYLHHDIGMRVLDIQEHYGI